MTQLIWKPIIIDGKQSTYRIANSGAITNENGIALSPYPINTGYLAIQLSVNGVRHHFLIHRLVALHFIPNPNNLPDVNHKDANKQNNWDWNLEWCTKSGNMQHASVNGLLKPRVGSTNPFAIHDEAQIHKACKLMEEDKMSLMDISAVTGVSYKILQGIKFRDKWKQISSQYNIPPSKRPDPWNEETGAAIQILKDKNYTYQEISRLVGLPETNASKLRIGRYLDRVKSSTTIPWIVFDFLDDHQE